jgi:hypothetical protein
MLSADCKNVQILYLNFLEGTVDHRNQHIQKNDDHRNVVDSIEDITDVLNELVVVVDDH